MKVVQNGCFPEGRAEGVRGKADERTWTAFLRKQRNALLWSQELFAKRKQTDSQSDLPFSHSRDASRTLEIH